MNIENSNVNQVKEIKSVQNSNSKKQESSVEFSEELKEIKSAQNPEIKKEEKIQASENNEEKTIDDYNDKSLNNNQINISLEKDKERITFNNVEHISSKSINNNDKSLNFQIEQQANINLQLTETSKIDQEKKLNSAIDNLNTLVKDFNQSDEKLSTKIKFEKDLADNNSIMINKDYNIQDKDILPQMNPNMNFSGNGQPFSSFMNDRNNNQHHSDKILGNSVKDLAEESAILSTMSENIAIANKNKILQDVKTVLNEEGIKKVDVNSGITIENIVKYDSIIMNQADVEIFVELVEKGEVDLKNINSPNVERFMQVSKTLGNLLAKSMENNQPLRIDFDNDISVIIRISRDGKISADFLPSSQIAEAYLKENLPLLRQRFEDNNIEYDSLNQRERKDSQKEQNKKKGRNNE